MFDRIGGSGDDFFRSHLLHPGTIDWMRRKSAWDERRLPPKPTVPPGEPIDYYEALFSTGACAVPEWSFAEGRWRFLVIIDGSKVKEIDTQDSMMADTYEQALAIARALIACEKALPSKVPTPAPCVSTSGWALILKLARPACGLREDGTIL